jgi:hypothetical protein
MSDDVVSYDTNAQNPAPRGDGASPVKWGEILAALAAETVNADRWQKMLAGELAASEMAPRERAVLQSAIAQHERRAEVFGAAWRFVWALRGDPRLRERLRDVLAAERGGEIDTDQVRYE